MKILIIGATRGIGFELAKQALQENHEVTVLARKPENFKLQADKLRVVKGDIANKNSIKEAVQNQDAVCSTIGISPTFKTVTIFSEGAKNVIEAMQSAGVKRLIAVTGIGAGNSQNHGGFLYDKIIKTFILKTIYEDKDREEAVIKSSRLDWIVVRPGFLTNGEQTGKYRTLTNLNGIKAGKISRADVADFILKNLAASEFLRQTPLLTY